ncbi:DUF1513 domain-containing protein [Rhodobacteraceae bacterium CCMM004]|nr:DUF1513 domain-containing protein [Rhodobacteraceae bacterium CCMM004]
MPGRRAVLSGLLASALVPAAVWADAGAPAYLSAARRPDGTYALCGLDAGGSIVFEIALPGRGHAAAAHPTRPLAVVFARRPGRFALVIDCATGRVAARLAAPEGRHFYGHGAFSGDGATLFTTENDFDGARGLLGIWDAEGFARLGEVPSGGVGPHDIACLPDGATLVVANGGIETHPDTGRAKLNLATMRPNLSFLDLGGRILERVEAAPALHRNSIRHLAVDAQGGVVAAMQWQGDMSARPPLVATCARGAGALTPALEGTAADPLRGYVGSVAVSADGRTVAATSPRGGVCAVGAPGGPWRTIRLADVGGVAAAPEGFVVTTGTGRIACIDGVRILWSREHPRQWDNHIVAVPPPAGAVG